MSPCPAVAALGSLVGEEELRRHVAAPTVAEAARSVRHHVVMGPARTPDTGTVVEGPEVGPLTKGPTVFLLLRTTFGPMTSPQGV